MPDEAQAPDDSGQAITEPEAPAGDNQPGEDTVEYWKAEAERRSEAYNDRRSEFDRSQQQNAQYQQVWEGLQDEERRVELLQAIAPDLFEEEDDDDDGDQFQDPRVDSLLQEREQERQQQQVYASQQAEKQHLDYAFDSLEKTAGREFTDQEIATLVKVARLTPLEQGAWAGYPDVEAAYKEIYEGIVPGERDRYRQSKRSPQAPGGSAAQESVDLDDPQALEDYVDSRLAEVDDANRV